MTVQLIRRVSGVGRRAKSLLIRRATGVGRRAKSFVSRHPTPVTRRPTILLLLLLTSGCVMGRTYREQPLDETKIAGLQRGVTTKAEVLEKFGPPQEIDARELTAIGIPFEPYMSRRGERPPEERIVAARWFRYTYSRGNARR